MDCESPEKVGCSSVPSSLKDYISSSYSSERVTSVTPSSTSFRSNASTTSENSFIEQRRLHMFSSSTSASSSTDNILDAVDHDTLEDESLTDEKDDLLNQCLLAIKELKKEVDEQKAKVVILEEVVLDQEKTTEMFKKEHAKVLILEKVVLDQEKTTEILKKEHEKEKTAYDNLLKKATNRIMQLQKKRVESGKGGKKQQKKSVKPAPSDTMTELKELLKSLKT